MRAVNGQQSTVNSQQSTANGQQSTVNSQQSTVNGQQSTVNSQQPLLVVMQFRGVLAYYSRLQKVQIIVGAHNFVPLLLYIIYLEIAVTAKS
ncbi:hypothetical protein H6G27_18465 [Nostoc linckia FACHB-104]|nr:hypothetical protein [Nostoc linckia FACHB-104]